MGRPLVATPDNFGVSGQLPSHPELLDKLATRLVELDWNTDALIREIVLSRAWGLSNDHQADAHAKDPDNKMYWRSTPRRLPAEAIRDSMLMASGELISSRPEGSPISFFFWFGTIGAIASRTLRTRSPSLGVSPQSSGAPAEFLAAFDGADPSFVTGIRDETNVPTQALQLLNDDFVVGRADALARQVLQTTRSDVQHVREVFRRTLGRDPTAAEQQSAMAFLQDVSRLHTKDDAFVSLESPDQWSVSRLRRLAPDAGQDLSRSIDA